MKRRIFYLFPVLLILASIGVEFAQPQQADAASAAASYCSSAGYSSPTDISNCESHFNQGADKVTVSTTCPTSLEGFPSPGAADTGSGTAFFECESDWAAGANAYSPGSGSRASNPTYCQSNFTGNFLSDCNIGFSNSGKAESAACSNKNDPAYDACIAGFAENGGKGSPPQNRGSQPSAAAQAYCQSKTGSAYTACVSGYDGHGCSTFSGSDKTECTAAKAAKAAATAPTPSTLPNTLQCGISLFNPLTWFICPVVKIMGALVSEFDSLITNELNVKTNQIFCTSGSNLADCTAYYQAWQSFRDIALGLIVIAGLVIVTAEALGVEILDAYTIRRTLPRLLVAAIGITVSWPLMNFMINASNDLGYGVRGIIYYPFSHLSGGLDLSFGGNAANLFFGSAVTGVGAAAGLSIWLVFGGVGALFAFVGTALLAVIVAVVTLILRQIAIILLLLVSPIAIVAYILPHTQRIYKFWWESFSKALLMFPLIAAFIATGRVFSAVAINSGGTINQFIGFIAYFAPYFMIPMTFKFAGAAVGQLGGFVNARAQGGFKGLRDYRKGQREKRRERVRGRGLYRKDTGLTGKLNKLGHYTHDFDEQIPYDLGSGTGIAGGKRNPLGKAGKKLFGLMAAEQAGEKANQYAEQTAKGVEKANMHYSTAWAALGLRSRLKDGMSEDGLAKMDKEYGAKYDEKGNLVRTKEGEEAEMWMAPDNGDFHGLQNYASTLRSGAEAGSMAQYAAMQLDDGKAGILSSFGSSMDTQRASLQSVAMASAAKDGKLDADEMNPILNKMSESVDPAARAFGQAQLGQIERATQGARQDLRPGKGIRYDANGKLYNVHGHQQISVKQKDKNPDGTDRYEQVEAYRTKEAYDSSKSMKGQAALAAKAESIRNQADTILDMAKMNTPENFKTEDEAVQMAIAMRQSVAAGAQNSYSDPDSQVAWQEIASKLDLTEDEMKHGREVVEEEHEHESGGHIPPPSSGTPPPLIPPSGGIPPPQGL
jgi:hypothetical protein